MNTSILIESLDLSEAQFDSANRVLKNVGLIKAGKSLNKRHYPESVLQQAVTVFEGSKAFDSHAKGERRVGELTGWYENVRYENGTLKADRHFLPTQAGKDVMAVVEAIVTGGAPRTLAGLSINAVGSGKMAKIEGEDVLNVESITSANSVDDVVNPAAGGAYVLTASSGDELAQSYLQALTYEEWFESRPEHRKRLQNELKTARQDDALKAAKAEAESNLTALTEAQMKLKTLEEAHDAAVANEATARRELALEKAFRKAGFPAATEDSLREQLADLHPDKWAAVISRKRSELKALGISQRVTVTGAGQQIAPTPTPVKTRNPVKEMREAIAQASSPEELQRILQTLGS